MTRVLACPHCRKADQVALTEVHEEYGETDPGTVHIDERGGLIPPSEWMFSAGDPIRVSARCGHCGHEWRPRSQSISSRPTPGGAA